MREIEHRKRQEIVKGGYIRDIVQPAVFALGDEAIARRFENNEFVSDFISAVSNSDKILVLGKTLTRCTLSRPGTP